MLTLTAIAIFPIACVSYVIVRDEVRNVTRSIDFEVHDAALSAEARFARPLDRRQLRAVTAASSSQLQAAIGRHDTAALERFARRHRLLLEVDGHTYGQRLPNAVTARVQLVRHASGIGAVVAQLPLDARTQRIVSAGASNGVRVMFVDYPTTRCRPGRVRHDRSPGTSPSTPISPRQSSRTGRRRPIAASPRLACSRSWRSCCSRSS